MLKFEPYYRVATNAQILQTENAFREDVDFRLNALENASSSFDLAATEARDQIVTSYDQEIAPRVEELVSILSQYSSNVNAMRDSVLTLVRDGVDGSGDTLKKLLNLINGKAAANHGHAVETIVGLAQALDDKANANHGHDLGQISGAAQAFNGKLSRASNLSDLLDAFEARENLGFTWYYPPGDGIPGYVWTSSNGQSHRPHPFGTTRNTVPFIDPTGAIVIQKPQGVHGWVSLVKSYGLSNDSGLEINANNDVSFVTRDHTGSIKTWIKSDDSGHLIDGRLATFCRAWANINTITGAIRSSFNVSSVTKNGGGDITVNFFQPMPDANYAVIPARSRGDANAKVSVSPTDITATSVRLFTGVASIGPGWEDAEHLFVAIFR